MAKAIVKCLYCEQNFDRNDANIKSIKIKNRYAHAECAERHQSQMTEEEKDLEQLNDYIKNKFGKVANWALIKKQIAQYKEEGKTYKGILKTLIYWFEIKNNYDLEKTNGGIGIIKYVYDQALDYYYELHLARQRNEKKDITNFKIKRKEVSIRIPQREIKPIKLFDLGED